MPMAPVTMPGLALVVTVIAVLLIDDLRLNVHRTRLDVNRTGFHVYRARLHIPAEKTPYGMEVTERDVVRGSVRIVYEIRCTCRRRWFQRTFERVQVCPRCGSAVLVERPD